MTKEDMLMAMGELDEEMIEASEARAKRGFRTRASLVLAVALVFLFSVTAVAAAGFFNTVNKGELVFMEAVGGYYGDSYKINFDIDVAEDSDYLLHDYYVPTYLEENGEWTDC